MTMSLGFGEWRGGVRTVQLDWTGDEEAFRIDADLNCFVFNRRLGGLGGVNLVTVH
jgi:hypothetical protein